jgi:cob(I)alamin adenosyltransferase
MKLYTGTGDDGTTGLFGGDRVAKDDPRVVAYGTVDELNAALGLAAGAVGDEAPEGFASLVGELQSQLFDLGADLATPAGSEHAAKIVRLGADDVARLERLIDEVDAGNEPMTSFVLPGGTELAARLHVARAVCRRAERAMITLARGERVTADAITWMNRLGDLLFAMARRANAAAGVPDVPWRPAADGAPGD